MNLLLTPAPLRGAVTPPGSKSQAHRLVIAAMLAGECDLSHLAISDDITATIACMTALSSPGPALPVLDCGESGSTLRFLIPLALALRGGGVFTGRGRLMQRPLTPYFDLFDQQGISYDLTGDALIVRGRLRPGRIALPGDVSSQFITGLLYALPLLAGDSELVLTSPLESAGYVDMTLDTLSAFGVRVDGRYTIPGGQTYTPARPHLEADYSQAAFFFAANVIGNHVDVRGLSPHSRQGDRIIMQYCRLLQGQGAVTLDVSQCPDLVPALALAAALRSGQTTDIVGAARLRAKESDRLDTVTTQLNALGADIVQTPDSLHIRGVSRLTGGTVSGCGDHRIAMMLGIAATCAGGPVVLQGAQCVSKSYPLFWHDYAALGGLCKEV